FVNLEAACFCNSVDKMRRCNTPCDSLGPTAAFGKIICQKCDQLIRRNKFAAAVNDPKSIAVTISRKPKRKPFASDQFAKLANMFFAWLRCLSAECNVTPIVNRLDLQAIVAKQLVKISPARAPQRVVCITTLSVGDRFQIYLAGKVGKIPRSRIVRLDRSAGVFASLFAAGYCRLYLPGYFRQC